MFNKSDARPPKKKIHSKDEFELCYLRHKYIRRIKYVPTKEEMLPYHKIVKRLAKNTFIMYKNLFRTVGLDLDDLFSIGHIHLVTYLGLFSIDRLPDKYAEFVNIFQRKNNKIPSSSNILDKNKANCTIFLKQRMEDVVRVCRQKSRNIKGLPMEEYHVFYGPHKPPKFTRVLLQNYEKMGYRKLDLAVYKSIKKKLNIRDNSTFKFSNNWYICVPLNSGSLDIVDFTGADMSPYDNIHNMSPEEVFFTSTEKEYWNEKREEFSSKSRINKIKTIKSFIKDHKHSAHYKDEIKEAKRILKQME